MNVPSKLDEYSFAIQAQVPGKLTKCVCGRRIGRSPDDAASFRPATRVHLQRSDEGVSLAFQPSQKSKLGSDQSEETTCLEYDE